MVRAFGVQVVLGLDTAEVIIHIPMQTSQYSIAPEIRNVRVSR